MAIGYLIDLGLVEYGHCLELQRRLWEIRAKDEIPDTLVLVEHPPVVTMGRSARTENIRVSMERLAQAGVALYRVERGGDVTFHGPGQLVGYPVFRLGQGLVGVKPYVDRLQRVLITALAELGVAAQTRQGLPGVWVEDRKIASLGIAVRRWVTLHGFALNVTTDLSWFSLINPCGMRQVQMTSIEQERGRTDRVRPAVVSAFESIFGLEFQVNLPRSITLLTNGLRRSAIASASARV